MTAPLNRFTGDGATTTFQYTFDDDLSTESAIVVTLSQGDVDTVQALNTDYTLNSDTKTITFITAPPDDSIIVIQRFTTRDRQIDWQSGGTINEPDLDEDCNRLTAVTQEIEGDLDDCMRLNAAGVAWDSRGLQIKRGSPGTARTDFVTLGQVNDIVGGSETAHVDNGSVICHQGDGTETEFPIIGFKGLDAGQITVYVQSVYQSICPDDPSYDVLNFGDSGYPGPDGGPSYIVFAEPVDSGDEIEIRIVQGTVVTTLGDGSVDGDMIQDGAIGTNHLFIGGGDSGRILIFDAQGDCSARVPVPGDIVGFDARVRSNRLDQMQPPDSVLNLDGAVLTGIAAASAASDAVPYAQLLSALNARLSVKHGGIAVSHFPTAVNQQTNLVSNIGFVPDLFIFTAKYDNVNNNHVTYIACFLGSSTTVRRLGGPEGRGGKIPPVVDVDRDADSIQLTLVQANDLTAWSEGGYIAIKLGES